jgi:endonuclease YncB( thermonuclease family)
MICMERIMGRLLLACVTFFIVTAAHAVEIAGRVVGVSDGDTLTLLTADKQQIKVRLAEIDTPEKAQPYGQKSRQALAAMTFQKHVTLVVQDRDRYGRTVARVNVDGVDVNRKLVVSGAAWVYRQYSRDPSMLQAEAEAKAAKRGLWALPEAERIPPWEWRRGSRISSAEPKPSLVAASTASSEFSCSPRKTCGQMSSCAEARYHLETCGNGRLDRDNDGVPCETLCE